jgi:uncharacterized protein DUF1996
MLRSKTGTTRGICHRCNGNGAGGAPCDSRDSSELPTKMCPGGIRASVIFPSCWDGKNLDSPDHRSHVAYSPSRNVLANDACPSTHPIRIPQIMYEIQWATAEFNNPEYFKGGKQPFVYSFGDPYEALLNCRCQPTGTNTSVYCAVSVTANMETISSAGRAMPCNGEWTRRWGRTASMISAMH